MPVNYPVWCLGSSSNKSDGLPSFWFSVPEGPNVYRTKGQKDFEAPEERNMWLRYEAHCAPPELETLGAN
jgi:hypothetical protein